MTKPSLPKPLRVFNLGRGVINCFSWSPDQRLLAFGGDDHTVYVFTPKGVPRWHGKKHNAPIESLAWSPNGRYLASGSDDSTIRLWSGDGTELCCIQGHQGIVASLAWSPDSRRLVSGSDDYSLRIWSVPDGRELRRLEGHDGAIWSVAWSVDGHYLASGAGDRSIRLWSALSGAELRCLTGHTHQVTNIAWSPDNRRLASGARDHTVRLWAAQDGSELHRLTGREGTILSMAWSPDGQGLALGSSSGLIYLWSGTSLRHLQGSKKDVMGVAWSADASHLAMVTRDGSFALWEVAAPLTTTPTAVAADAIQWLVRQAATVGRRAPPWIPHLPQADPTEHRGLGILYTAIMTHGTQRSGAPSIAMSPDGRRLASAHLDGHLRCWDLLDGRLLWTSTQPPAETATPIVQDLAWSPDGGYLAAGMENGAISLWSATDGVELQRFPGHRAPIASIAWSPDGGCLASGAADHTIRLWSADQGVELKCLNGHSDVVRSVAWSPDGNHLASAAHDRSIRLWSVREGRELRCLEGHTDLVYSIAWSPDGQRLASGSQDGTIRLWSVADGREQQQFTAHSGAVFQVAWSADGTRLASGSMDCTLRVWDMGIAAVELCVLPLRFNSPGYVWRLAWARNGGFLVSSHAGNTIYCWDSQAPRPPPSTNLRTVDLATLPAALSALHRLGIYPPLSLVYDLRILLGGGCPLALAMLPTRGISALQSLRWSSAARTGLIALLLRDLPDTDWHPPPELDPGLLRTALACALDGETITRKAPLPPLAMLDRAITAIDSDLLTLIAALGGDAVAADPGILLRLSNVVKLLCALDTTLRQLLRCHLTPLAAEQQPSPLENWQSSRSWLMAASWGLPTRRGFPPGMLLAHWPHRLHQQERTDSQSLRIITGSILCPHPHPTVIVLDCSAVHGVIENLLRTAAYALAVSLRRWHLPVVLVSAGNPPTVHLLGNPEDLLIILTQRNPGPPDVMATLAVATRLYRQFISSHSGAAALLLFTHPQWGADVVPCVPYLRALFVHNSEVADQICPLWAKYCERWEMLTADQHADLPEILGRLIG